MVRDPAQKEATTAFEFNCDFLKKISQAEEVKDERSREAK